MLPNDLAILTSTWQPCPQFREFIFFSWFKTHPWFKKSNPYLFFLSNKPRPTFLFVEDSIYDHIDTKTIELGRRMIEGR